MQPEPLYAHFKLLAEQNKQLKINERWLIEQISIMHDLLCPNKIGTWQDRARHVIEKVKELTKKG